MKVICNKIRMRAIVCALLSFVLLLGGCTNINPTDPQQPPYSPPSAGQPPQTGGDVTVTYNYNATDKVQLSANNIMLKTGQKLIIKPVRGLTENTRFTSSGENFFGDIMKQEENPQASGQVVFTAIKTGKGKLQIIPNTNDLDRAVDLWVTVQ